MESQKVSFVLSKCDLLAGWKFFLRHTPAGRRWKWLCVAHVEIGFVLAVITLATLTHSVIIGIVIFALGQLGVPFGIRNMSSGNLGYTENQMRVICSPTAMEINSDAFYLENDYLKLRRRWQMLELVAGDDCNLYIFPEPKSMCMVPKRAFNNEEEFVRFCEMAKLYWESAGKSSAQGVKATK